MQANDLFRSIGELDEQTLLDVEGHRKRKARPSIRLIAASLAFFVIASGICYHFIAGTPEQAASSWFVIAAQGVQGDWDELDSNGAFNSAPPGSMSSLFPMDVPHFSFVVKPSNRGDDPEAYSGFIISVSCSGKSTEFLNDHVAVMHQYACPGSDAPYHSIVVMGWFEEATDIIISIMDNQTGELMEEQTVHVCYIPDAQAYQLTVTDVQTHHTEK